MRVRKFRGLCPSARGAPRRAICKNLSAVHAFEATCSRRAPPGAPAAPAAPVASPPAPAAEVPRRRYRGGTGAPHPADARRHSASRSARNPRGADQPAPRARRVHTTIDIPRVHDTRHGMPLYALTGHARDAAGSLMRGPRPAGCACARQMLLGCECCAHKSDARRSAILSTEALRPGWCEGGVWGSVGLRVRWRRSRRTSRGRRSRRGGRGGAR